MLIVLQGGMGKKELRGVRWSTLGHLPENRSPCVTGHRANTSAKDLITRVWTPCS